MKQKIKKYTVYLDSDLHRALRVKSAETDISVSQLVNEAIRNAMKEDAIDLKAYKERKSEPSIAFEKILDKLERDGKV